MISLFFQVEVGQEFMLSDFFHSYAIWIIFFVFASGCMSAEVGNLWHQIHITKEIIIVIKGGIWVAGEGSQPGRT